MGGGDGCRYVGDDISQGWMMAACRSPRRLLTLIRIGLVLPHCLIYCVLSFVYYILRFMKSYWLAKVSIS